MTAVPQYSTWGELFRRVTGKNEDGERVADPQPLTADEAYQVITGYIRLPSGGGTLNSNGKLDKDTEFKTYLCIMQTVNVYHALITGQVPTGADAGYLIYNDYSVSPSYGNVDEVDTVIESMMVSVNDSILSDQERQKLMTLVPKLLNTKIDAATSERVRVAKQMVLDMAGKAYDEWSALYDKNSEATGESHTDTKFIGAVYGVSPLTYHHTEYVPRDRDNYLTIIESRYDEMDDAWSYVPRFLAEHGRVDEAIDFIEKIIEVKAPE